GEIHSSDGERWKKMQIPYGEKKPNVHPTVFVAEGARSVGDVEIGGTSSVWCNAVVRGDVDKVRIGKEANIQDGAIGHQDAGRPLIVGDRVTVGHGAIIHGCTIKDGALIGMGAVILSGAEVGENALVAAG